MRMSNFKTIVYKALMGCDYNSIKLTGDDRLIYRQKAYKIRLWASKRYDKNFSGISFFCLRRYQND